MPTTSIDSMILDTLRLNDQLSRTVDGYKKFGAQNSGKPEDLFDSRQYDALIDRALWRNTLVMNGYCYVGGHLQKMSPFDGYAISLPRSGNLTFHSERLRFEVTAGAGFLSDGLLTE